MKFTKLLLATVALVAATAPAFAISKTTGSLMNCRAYGYSTGSGNNSTPTNLAQCAINITSATTISQIGTVSVDPTKQVYVYVRGSTGTSASITLTDSLGAVVNTIPVSVTTVPNLVQFTAPIYFTGIVISGTIPLSGVNAISASVIENRQ